MLKLISIKEYVEWVGTCETEVVEKAQIDGQHL